MGVARGSGERFEHFGGVGRGEDSAPFQPDCRLDFPLPIRPPLGTPESKFLSLT